jgi:prevent-host-death family protein
MTSALAEQDAAHDSSAGHTPTGGTSHRGRESDAADPSFRPALRPPGGPRLPHRPAPLRQHPAFSPPFPYTLTNPLVQARNGLGQLINRVRHGHETIVISDYGSPAAALIPIGELDELRRLRDGADIAEAGRRKATAGQPVTHEAFMDALDAEDAQAAAS